MGDSAGRMYDRFRSFFRARDEPPSGPYDTRPVYDLPPEDDPGMGGVPGGDIVGEGSNIDPHAVGLMYGMPVLLHPDVKSEVLDRLHRNEKFTMSLTITPDPNEEGMRTKGEWRM